MADFNAIAHNFVINNMILCLRYIKRTDLSLEARKNKL